MNKKNNKNKKKKLEDDEDEESEYALKLDDSILGDQKEILDEKSEKRKFSHSISFSDKAINFESGIFNFGLGKDKHEHDEREISIAGEHDNLNIEAMSLIFKKDSENIHQDKNKEILEKKIHINIPAITEKLTEELPYPDQSKKNCKITSTRNIQLPSSSDSNYNPLELFLLALEFVKRIKQQENSTKFHPTSKYCTYKTKALLNKRSYRNSELEEMFNQDLKKCQKFSRKLKRAWNLDQQILQNVFKKIFKQSKKSLSEAVSYHESYRSRSSENINVPQKSRSILFYNNAENNPNMLNVEGSRNLRTTTRIKKHQTFILNRRKRQLRQNKGLKKSVEFEYFELIDYGNKNISKNCRFKDDDSDDENQN